MSNDFSKRLDKILERVTSDDFLQGKGLGNEIPFYAFDYPPTGSWTCGRISTFCWRRSPSAAPQCA